VQAFGEYDVELPGHYGDAARELDVLDRSAGLVDASHFGRVHLTGRDVISLLHRLSTNDLNGLVSGQARQTVLTSEKGRILDVVTVLHAGDRYVLHTSPTLVPRIIRWLDRFTIRDDVRCRDVSADTFRFDLIGPDGGEVLRRVGWNVPKTGEAIEVETVDLSVQILAHETGGVCRFIVSGPEEHAASVAQSLTHNGAVCWCGWTAFLAWRIGRAIPLYPFELNELYNPLEAGLARIVSFTKGCYIGQEVIARLDSYNKIQKHLRKLSLSSEVVPGPLFSGSGKEIGIVTSVCPVPSVRPLTALSYVKTEFADSQEDFFSDSSIGRVTAKILPVGS
jgi:hypothetical protein